MIRKPRRAKKQIFTATHRPTRYLGEHPALKGTEGVFYYSLEQGVNVYKPNSEDSKGDWFRIPDERNLEGV